MSKVYIIATPNWQYNDEYHYAQGSDVSRVFDNRDKATLALEKMKEKEIDKILSGELLLEDMPRSVVNILPSWRQKSTATKEQLDEARKVLREDECLIGFDLIEMEVE